MDQHMDQPEDEAEAPRRRSSLLLAVGLVAAAAALVLAVLPQPTARTCDGVIACVSAGPARQEVVVMAVRSADPAAPPIAEVFRSIRTAGADGAAPPIPPSETWPAQ